MYMHHQCPNYTGTGITHQTISPPQQCWGSYNRYVSYVRDTGVYNMYMLKYYIYVRTQNQKTTALCTYGGKPSGQRGIMHRYVRTSTLRAAIGLPHSVRGVDGAFQLLQHDATNGRQTCAKCAARLLAVHRTKTCQNTFWTFSETNYLKLELGICCLQQCSFTQGWIVNNDLSGKESVKNKQKTKKNEMKLVIYGRVWCDG